MFKISYLGKVANLLTKTYNQKYFSSRLTYNSLWDPNCGECDQKGASNTSKIIGQQKKGAAHIEVPNLITSRQELQGIQALQCIGPQKLLKASSLRLKLQENKQVVKSIYANKNISDLNRFKRSSIQSLLLPFQCDGARVEDNFFGGIKPYYLQNLCSKMIENNVKNTESSKGASCSNLRSQNIALSEKSSTTNNISLQCCKDQKRENEIDLNKIQSSINLKCKRTIIGNPVSRTSNFFTEGFKRIHVSATPPFTTLPITSYRHQIPNQKPTVYDNLKSGRSLEISGRSLNSMSKLKRRLNHHISSLQMQEMCTKPKTALLCESQKSKTLCTSSSLRSWCTHPNRKFSNTAHRAIEFRKNESQSESEKDNLKNITKNPNLHNNNASEMYDCKEQAKLYNGHSKFEPYQYSENIQQDQKRDSKYENRSTKNPCAATSIYKLVNSCCRSFSTTKQFQDNSYKYTDFKKIDSPQEYYRKARCSNSYCQSNYNFEIELRESKYQKQKNTYLLREGTHRGYRGNVLKNERCEKKECKDEKDIYKPHWRETRKYEINDNYPLTSSRCQKNFDHKMKLKNSNNEKPKNIYHSNEAVEHDPQNNVSTKGQYDGMENGCESDRNRERGNEAIIGFNYSPDLLREHSVDNNKAKLQPEVSCSKQTVNKQNTCNHLKTEIDMGHEIAKPKPELENCSEHIIEDDLEMLNCYPRYVTQSEWLWMFFGRVLPRTFTQISDFPSKSPSIKNDPFHFKFARTLKTEQQLNKFLKLQCYRDKIMTNRKEALAALDLMETDGLIFD